ncbi:MAG TPA: hypothetical protein VJT50_08900, partial [Pyrinomonadaceae bacterium]|nr:hypothetical protein [Pyrinomonadaceae bacterium]
MTVELAPIKFGTDGWRAIIAREYTFQNLERVAQAFADFLVSNKAAGHLDHLVEVGQLSKLERDDKLFSKVVRQAVSPPLAVVGFDRRFRSEVFAQRAAEVLNGNDIQVLLFDEAAPTPLI